MTKKKFLRRLRVIREYLGININQLSLLTGIRPNRLSKIERQLCRAKPDEIQKIVLALGTNEELLTGEKNETRGKN